MTRRSPQEKKTLSYKKDRRNTYGENAKSSVKSIRVRKRLVNRAARRVANQALSPIVGENGRDQIEQSDKRLTRKASKGWSKFPDEPLGEVLIAKLKRKVRLGIDNPSKAADKIARIQRRLRAR
jgi:hypothetical protein